MKNIIKLGTIILVAGAVENISAHSGNYESYTGNNTYQTQKINTKSIEKAISRPTHKIVKHSTKDVHSKSGMKKHTKKIKKM